MTERKKAGADKLVQGEQVTTPQNEVTEVGTQQITCGLIMPIAANEVGSEEHWLQVRKIISDALIDTGFKIKMVSDSDEVNVIHQNIVANIYTNEIIICDVSSRNPNVMFELGMRLTFDKPVVIIKDRDTPFSFDVGNIQHLEYPRSLNYVEIQHFQKGLKEKVISTMEASKAEGYSPFLSNYKITQVSKVETKVVGREDYIISAINDLKSSLNRVNFNVATPIEKSKFEEAFLNEGGMSVTRRAMIEDDIYSEVISRYGNKEIDENAILMAHDILRRKHGKLSQSMRNNIVARLTNRLNPASDLI